MIDPGEHFGLARYFARRVNQNLPDPEAVEEVAMLTLIRAARRFDEAAGSWAAYASVSIERAVRGEVGRQLRAPRATALFVVGEDGEEEERRDLPHVDPVGPTRLEAREFREALAILDAREREILVRHFGLDGPEETLEAVGARLGLSRARVGQIEARALGKLRRVLSGRLARAPRPFAAARRAETKAGERV